MPCLKQPPTLEACGINCLVTRVCHLCNAIEELEAEDPQRARKWADDLAGQFSVFPGKLLGKFLEPAVMHIMEKVCHRRGHKGVPTLLKCLLQPPLTEVNLSGLFFKSRLPADVNRRVLAILPSAFSNMKNLRVLNLTAKATNEILHAVCRHCPDLEELNVALSNIDDDGLKLFGNVLDGHNQCVGCPKLTNFSIFKCWLVTPRAVARVLRDLTKLQRLEYDDCVSCLRILYSDQRGMGGSGRKRTLAALEVENSGDGPGVNEDTSSWSLSGVNVSSRRVFGLTHLDQTAKRFQPSEDFLKFVLSSCPNVESLSLLTHDEDQLTELPRFEKLNSVSVELSRGPAGQCFRAFVQAMGSRLVNLNLVCEDLPVVSLCAIGTTCVNLKQLKIVRRTASGLERDYKLNSGAFRSLQLLNLTTASADEPMTKEECLFFLSDAKDVEEIHFNGTADFMDDDFWTSFLENVNPLNELRVLKLIGGPNPLNLGRITAKSFIKTCPKLKEMTVTFWEHVSPGEFRKLKNKLKESNFDFHLL